MMIDSNIDNIRAICGYVPHTSITEFVADTNKQNLLAAPMIILTQDLAL